MTLTRQIRIALLALAAATFAPAADAFADTRIETVERPAVAATDGGIVLSAPEATLFEVYSITGQLVRQVTVEGAQHKVELPNGCYIVRCALWSKKVVVK